MSELRLSGYYFSFTPTGDRSVDLLLSAIACAGKAYHHTEDWGDEATPIEPEHRGGTPVEWIQNAAVDVAQRLVSCGAVQTNERRLKDEALVRVKLLEEALEAIRNTLEKGAINLDPHHLLAHVLAALAPNTAKATVWP